MGKPLKRGLLAETEIRSELAAERLFTPGTWDERCIRSAGYDVRLAPDLMYVPDAGSANGARFYPRGSHRAAAIILQPGDTAFVSTVERLCVPWNVSGAVGPKFGLTAKGILMLTGFLIDPGYGLRLTDDGSWTSASDERLHFFLANVGPLPIVLVPGVEAIATLQFSWVSEGATKRETPSGGFGLINDAFLQEEGSPQGPLLFFKSLADLKSQSAELKQTVDLIDNRLDRVEAGTGQIVLFGVYLISATFLGIVFALLIDLSKNGEMLETVEEISAVLARGWPALSVFGLAVVGAAFLIMRAARYVLSWRRKAIR